MQSILRRPLKWLGYLALGCYVILAIAIIGVRYWLLPNIDQWREPLEQQLSQMLELQLETGRISAVWKGVYPRLRVDALQLRDDAGRPLLEVPRVEAVVGWQSLLGRRLHLVRLYADGIQLTVRRDARNRIQVLGHEVDGAYADDETTEGGDETNFLGWLADHGQVHLAHASVRWLDERRDAPALEFDDVSLVLARDGDTHRLSMQARPPAQLGRTFSLQADVRAKEADDHSTRLDTLEGLFHVGVEGMRPAAWQPWLEAVTTLQHGEVSWHAWQEFRDGEALRHVTRITVDNAVWRPVNGSLMAAAKAELHMDGPWSELREIWLGESLPVASAAPQPQTVKLAMKVDGLHVEADDVLDTALAFGSIAMQGEADWASDTGLKVAADQLQLRNADMDVELSGSWQELGGEKAGIIDVEGRFNRAELPAIVRYLPALVDEDAKEWMRHGLLAGTLREAPLHLQGDLLHFPFGERPDAGDFRLAGRVDGAIIDYAPAALIGAPGWPRLEGINGRAGLHNVDLQIFADTALMKPHDQASIALRGVHARIPDIEQDAVLSVEGQGRADAASFLALLAAPRFSELLDGVFDESQGKGNWEVPISLTIPLTDTEETRVAGSVLFKDAELRLSPKLPVLADLNGRIDFSELAVVANDVKTTVLGGATTISGGLGEGHKALDFSGRLQGEALDHFLDGALRGRVKGTTPYQLSLRQLSGRNYGVSVRASLEGMQLDLPEPLAKPARERLPLAMQWTRAAGKTSGVLDVSLGDRVRAQFRQRSGEDSGPFFRSGVVSVGGKTDTNGTLQAPDVGFALDVVAAEVDIDGWRELLDSSPEAATPGGNGSSTERPAAGSTQSPSERTNAKGGQVSADAIFPPLRDIRIQAERASVFGTDLNLFTFTARRPEGDRWRVDVSSTETAGTLFWQERQGRIEGRVDAHFARLALGERDVDKDTDTDSTDGDAGTAWEVDGPISIPAIQLRVDRLSLYGRELGTVSVMGVNESLGRRWKLEQLEITSPHASVKGSGLWDLDGADRGLRIQADALFDDLGAYLDQLGFTELVQGGHGSVRGQIEWRGIPRKFEWAGLFGDLQVDLSKGRFLTVSSRSGRLLELLSLQSVKRLAARNWNPAGLTQQGFPFDTLQGRIKGEAGVLHSENYRVTSPVATIMMAGDVDLARETLDIHAAVVPTLDVSGAAIAAGIAVNPVVGLGAFLTQWLLKDPVSRAMTAEYRVKGTFDEPQLVEINTSDRKSGTAD